MKRIWFFFISFALLSVQIAHAQITLKEQQGLNFVSIEKPSSGSVTLVLQTNGTVGGSSSTFILAGTTQEGEFLLSGVPETSTISLFRKSSSRIDNFRCRKSKKTRDKVLVANPGDKPSTYRVEILKKRMADNGSYEDVEKPRAGELYADRYIRFSPRITTQLYF
jgi:hypothetical protein